MEGRRRRITIVWVDHVWNCWRSLLCLLRSGVGVIRYRSWGLGFDTFHVAHTELSGDCTSHAICSTSSQISGSQRRPCHSFNSAVNMDFECNLGLFKQCNSEILNSADLMKIWLAILGNNIIQFSSVFLRIFYNYKFSGVWPNSVKKRMIGHVSNLCLIRL